MADVETALIDKSHVSNANLIQEKENLPSDLQLDSSRLNDSSTRTQNLGDIQLEIVSEGIELENQSEIVPEIVVLQNDTPYSDDQSTLQGKITISVDVYIYIY